MGLINDDSVVFFEKWVSLGFGQQNPIGHQFDRRLVTGVISKADLITHILADGSAQLLRNSFSGTCGGNTTRLRMANESTLVDFAATQG